MQSFPFLGLCAFHATIGLFFFFIYISVYFPFIMPRATVTSSLDLCPPLCSSSFQGSLSPTICGISCGWFLPARPLCFYLPAFLLDKGAFRLHATQGQDRQEERGGHWWGEHTIVAGFATCIMWALCILCCSSSCPNWFFPLMPRTCLLESLNSGR